MAEDPTALLAALRAGGSAADRARIQLAAQLDLTSADPHASTRAQVAAALLQALAPADRPVALWLLGQEVAVHRAAGHGAGDTLLALVAAVARFGQAEDALLLWQAHAATPETRDAVEVEQLGRAGVARVRAWLLAQVAAGGKGAHDAAAALAWLDAGRAADAFDDLPAYFAWSDEIHGLTAGAPV
jgi:hypothetical protein